jgi:hypothetical protein
MEIGGMFGEWGWGIVVRGGMLMRAEACATSGGRRMINKIFC